MQQGKRVEHLHCRCDIREIAVVLNRASAAGGVTAVHEARPQSLSSGSVEGGDWLGEFGCERVELGEISVSRVEESFDDIINIASYPAKGIRSRKGCVR